MSTNILHELSLKNPGLWPEHIKWFSCMACVVSVFICAYLVDFSDQFYNLEIAQQKQKKLFHLLESQQKEAAQLDLYKKQMVIIKNHFNTLIQQLPTDAEIPKLLDDISKTGIANGLEFISFKPLSEIPGDFYAELPLLISLKGDYHQLARFVSRIATLDRIVTIKNFSLVPINQITSNAQQIYQQNKFILQLDIYALTYCYTGKEKI
jgi:type IV pilus assembly protein PilO